MIRKVILVGAVIWTGFGYAVDPSAVNTNISDLNNQIQQINQDLNSKQQEKQKIDAALKDSQGAISKTEAILQKIRKQRDADMRQLDQLSTTIPQITAATTAAKAQVNSSISKIYQQIQKVQASQQSIISGNDSLEQERKKIYLLELLKQQQARYQQLSIKLTQLDSLNQKLQQEVDKLNKRLGTTSQQHQQLLAVKDKTVQQSISVKQQIDTERSKLSHLKQRQAQLNKLLQQLALAEKKQKQAAAKKAAAEAKARQTAAVVKTQASNSPSIVKQQESLAVSSNNDSGDDVKITNATPATPQTSAIADNSVEDNSPFMARKLAKPISGEVAVRFGQMRDSVKNNGVLIHANDNTPVYSVSRGTVLFSGELTGFGQIIVIDNGDNYTSVYSGVLSKVAKGVTVTAGQLIASSGAEANQPMGGVYFELRHLGKPVNPNKLFD
ncbi:MAG: peptidoglycan DD-metalloendopeptidase family protein [Burkholderiales bacterium]|nr:peptidoglycan DD-metalloendopeptidase family protein [Burkholderiales bacterium]